MLDLIFSPWTALTIVVAVFILYPIYFWCTFVNPLKVWNRPRYWTALRWAIWFVRQRLVGRVEFRHQHGGNIWEAWKTPKYGLNDGTPTRVLALLWLAVRGEQFRMDETHSYVAMEFHKNDQQ